MIFIALMFLTTTCVAGAAAFFSVYGLAHTFAAAFWSVVFMGGSLEAGKLMITSYLYRSKDTISVGRKWLGILFVFGLMLITSLGIYGYLADAYQAGSTDMKQVNATLDLKKTEQANLQKRKAEIDGQIAQVPVKDVRGKQRLMTQYGPEVNTINKRLIEITSELQQDTQKQITTDSHVGPIIFIAKIVGVEPDKAMSVFILFIIFMFDPVAIYLTVATNEALVKYQTKIKVPEVPVQPTSSSAEFWAEQSEKSINLDDVYDPGVMQEDFNDNYWRAQEKANKEEISALSIFTPEELLAAEQEMMQEAPIDWSKVEVESMLRGEDESNMTIVTEPYKLSQVFSDHPLDESIQEDEGEGPVMLMDWTIREDEPVEEVPEVVVEPDPIEKIHKIYEAVTTNPDQTPADKETAKLIEKFFARQQLVKNVRTGNIKT